MIHEKIIYIHLYINNATCGQQNKYYRKKIIDKIYLMRRIVGTKQNNLRGISNGYVETTWCIL